MVLILYVTGGVKSLCYTDTNCTWSTIPSTKLSDLIERYSGYLQLSSESDCVQLEQEKKKSALSHRLTAQEQEMVEQEQNDTACKRTQ